MTHNEYAKIAEFIDNMFLRFNKDPEYRVWMRIVASGIHFRVSLEDDTLIHVVTFIEITTTEDVALCSRMVCDQIFQRFLRKTGSK